MTNTVLNWLRRHRQDIVLQSETIPFAASREWEFSPDGAVLRHKTGRFFSICGVTFTSTPTEHKAMELTLIDQQEIGILGFIVAKSGGQLAFLCQAKAEPGNIELVQLAPTLQATASNYQQIHGGLAQPFLDLFLHPSTPVLHDSHQTEQGWRFWHKANRNMVVSMQTRIEPSDHYQWIELDDILKLLQHDYVINSDARSVLVCLLLCDGLEYLPARPNSPVLEALLASLATTTATELQWSAWLNHFVTHNPFFVKTTRLCDLKSWALLPESIRCLTASRHTIRQISVTANCREVEHWDQPIIASPQPQEILLIGQLFDHVIHFLVKLEQAPGLLKPAGLQATLILQGDSSDPFDVILRSFVADHAGEALRRVSVHNSEEGGRFDHDANTHSLYLFDENCLNLDLPEHFRWLTLADLKHFLHLENILTNELRSVLSLVFFSIFSPA